MGISDAPACFTEMTAHVLQDLTTGLGLETFIDNNGLAGDNFKELLHRLHQFFVHCYKKGLSLSPSKTQLFMSEAVYEDACIEKDGIKPNLAKLEVIAKWPALSNIHELTYEISEPYRLLLTTHQRLCQNHHTTHGPTA